MVGADAATFKSLADETNLPGSRQESCKEDYAQASRSWGTVLEPHRRALDQPETKIDVLYSDADEDFEVFARSFRDIQILESVAQPSAADYAWPDAFTMEMRTCGNPSAAWSDETRTLRVCYDLAFDFAQLYNAYVPAAPALESTNQNENEAPPR
jgi:hypothetical protein